MAPNRKPFSAIPHSVTLQFQHMTTLQKTFSGC